MKHLLTHVKFPTYNWCLLPNVFGVILLPCVWYAVPFVSSGVEFAARWWFDSGGSVAGVEAGVAITSS